MTVFRDVAKFHALGGTEFPEKIQIPPDEMRALVMSLMTEEYAETTKGFLVDGDLPEAADGFLDLMYICIQGLLALGLKPAQIERLWTEVHAANMSKVDPQYGLLKENGGKPYFTPGGKITKPPGFLPPDLAGLIQVFKDFPDE